MASESIESMVWRIFQGNLGRSKVATLHLEQLIGEAEVPPDVLIVQEPYLIDGAIAGIPLEWRRIHREKGATAILVTNPNMDVAIKYLNAYIVAAELTTLRRRLIVISVYFPPSMPIDPFLVELDLVLSYFPPTEVLLVAGDWNAKHEAWGSPQTDDRGTSVMETVNGESWIDIAVGSDSLCDAQATWRVIEDTPSDHNYLTYEIGSKEFRQQSPRYKLNEFQIRKAIRHFSKQADELLSKIQEASTIQQLDEAVDKFMGSLKAVCDQHLLRKNLIRDRKVPWWDMELKVKRSKCRALRRRYTKSMVPQEKALLLLRYKRERATYRKMIGHKKKMSWLKFCERTASINAWQLPYKLAADKVYRPGNTR
ncbi:uncharacterized protein LOC118180282 [Stegodyphus dumicola]|uniref:uncharacterized protein LOC118180282 n=1 Tax=Stegodyphus dumicola TaxID=202533 RepID=UPI0015B228F2|nr:uncharacterized protein LOC118180282 [Stegodyphus dumicola]